MGWFNVLDYGAIGDGTTDDTAAVNLAIAALNTAAGGVLYFPAGTYKCTAALTTITAYCLILGDQPFATEIDCTSATAVLFTVTAKYARFANLYLKNTHGTPTAGAGIVASTTVNQKVDFDNVIVLAFYDNFDIQQGNQWVMQNCRSFYARRYGIRIRNLTNADSGDWSISNCNFVAGEVDSDAGIRIESSGGGKIINTKINEGGGFRFDHGIDVTTTAATSILLIDNCSIENVDGDGIHIATSGGSAGWGDIIIRGCQFGLFSNSTGNSININCGTLGDIDGLVITDNIFAGGTAAAAVSLTKVNEIRFNGNINLSFTAILATSGCTSIFEATSVAPGTYTDNAIARFDGTSGLVIQNSATTVDDSGSIILAASQDVKISSTTPAYTGGDGWYNQTAVTWTRTGNHTFTIAGTNVTVRYRKGTKVRYKDGGAYEYGVVGSSTFSTDTTVNLIPNTDYAMAATTITDNYVSFIENPEGWPGVFNYTPTLTGFSAAPTNTTYQWWASGNLMTVHFTQATGGTSDATTFKISVPVTAATLTNANWSGVAWGGVDNGVAFNTTVRVRVLSAGTTIDLFKDSSATAWTAANGKVVAHGTVTYQF